MHITVGGLLMFIGNFAVGVTITGTLFALFAQGMSDAPQDKFNWRPSMIAMAISIVIILIGKYSGL